MQEFILVERCDVLYSVYAESVEQAIDEFHRLPLSASFSTHSYELTVEDNDQNVLKKVVL